VLVKVFTHPAIDWSLTVAFLCWATRYSTAKPRCCTVAEVAVHAIHQRGPAVPELLPDRVRADGRIAVECLESRRAVGVAEVVQV
jgi:hypothetical protein